jgi:general secretion pathway protein F/type IV pilus assembly protein PilC
VPDFNYEALSSTGQRMQGNLTANSEREVLSMLDARGLYPVKIQTAKAAAGLGGIRIGGGIKTKHKTAFYSQLADLLHSGVPLLKSLEILENQSASPALSEVLREVKAAVADGTSLAEALGQHPRAFDELAVSMVRAGQEGGFLEDVLRRVADFNETQEDLKAKVAGALAYPIFLSTVGFLVLNALVVFVVPIFEKSFFGELRKKGKLPWLTSALIEVSHFMQGYFPAILAVVAIMFIPGTIGRIRKTRPGDPPLDLVTLLCVQFGILAVGCGLSMWLAGVNPYALLAVVLTATFIIGFQIWSGTRSGQLTLDGWKISMPTAGTIYLNFALARFTRLMGTLLKNGVPILQSLRIAKDTTGNKVLSKALEASADNITGGETLAAPLRACRYFPRDVVEMISVAEESNTLDQVLVNISQSLEKRTMRQLDLFVRLLEPIMLLVMGAFIGVILAGLLLPIFMASQAIK